MQRKKNLAAVVFWIAAIAWAGMLFFFSGQDGVTSGRLSRMVTEFLLRIFPGIPLDFETVHFFMRKLAHFSIFALEGLLLGVAMMLTLPQPRLGSLLAAVLCGIMAVLNELHQSFTVGRSCEVRDMIIDAAGGAAGVLAGALVLWVLSRLLRRRNVIIS